MLGFAGVQAESRYGIFLLPETSDGTTVGGTRFDNPPPAGGPAGEPPPAGGGTPAAPSPGGQSGGPVVTYPIEAIAGGVKLLVTNPREAGLLFLLWGLFAAPIYLALRRRSLSRALGE